MVMRRLGLFGAWLAATAVAVLLTTQAVQLVAGAVSDRPSPRVTPAAVATAAGSSASTVLSDDGSREAFSSSVPVPGASVTSTTLQVSTTSTTEEGSSPTSTTIVNESENFTLAGGTVTVACEGDDISLVAASPRTGFDIEVESDGPREVQVDFEEDDGTHHSRFQAECEEGEMDAKIREEDKDEEDDD
jgi:hypothetical protein